MSKSGLFGHFGSKEELQLATIEAAARRFVQRGGRAALGTEPEGCARLRALCERYLAYLERRVFPGAASGRRRRSSSTAGPGRSGTGSRTRFGAWLAELERQARIAGRRDPAQLAFELQALVQGANSSFQLFGDRRAFRPRARARSTELLEAAQAAKRAK